MDATVIEENDTGVSFRSICSEDFEEIKTLHENLFPVKYADSFYRDICVGKGLHGASIFSNIAIDDKTGEMVGFIISQFIPTTKCEDTNLFSFTLNTTQPDCVCYILTLGLIEKYRRSGLGTKLVMSCYEYAENNKSCGAIYLHVIHYNDNAIYFYKKNKFDFLRELHDFYLIENVHHSAHLYIRYLNNFKAPIMHSVSSVASEFALQSLSFISSLFTDVIGSSLSRALLSLSIMTPFGLHDLSENVRLVTSVVTSSGVSSSNASTTISTSLTSIEPERNTPTTSLIGDHMTASVDDVV